MATSDATSSDRDIMVLKSLLCDHLLPSPPTGQNQLICWKSYHHYMPSTSWIFKKPVTQLSSTASEPEPADLCSNRGIMVSEACHVIISKETRKSFYLQFEKNESESFWIITDQLLLKSCLIHVRDRLFLMAEAGIWFLIVRIRT